MAKKATILIKKVAPCATKEVTDMSLQLKKINQ